MTKEEKIKLIIIDSCPRIPYGLKFWVDNTIPPRPSTEDYKNGNVYDVVTADGIYAGDCDYPSIDVRETGSNMILNILLPYLRPISTMTDEEKEEFRKFGGILSYNPKHDSWAISAFSPEAYDWLNKNMFDYRNLIPKDLARKAPEGMYRQN